MANRNGNERLPMATYVNDSRSSMMKRIYVLKQHEQSLSGEQAFVTNSYHATLDSALFAIPEDEKTEAKKRPLNEKRKQVAAFENYSVQYHTLQNNTSQNSR